MSDVLIFLLYLCFFMLGLVCAFFALKGMLR